MFTSIKLPLVLFLLVCLCAVFLVSDFFISTKVSYKVTVIVETQDGNKVGVSTAQFINKPEIIKGYNTGNAAKSFINPIAINIDHDHQIYAIWDASLFYKAFPYEGGLTTRAGLKYHRNLKVGTQNQSPLFPIKLVYFEDKNDARSLKILSNEAVNQLVSIDQTVKLKNIIVEKVSTFKQTKETEASLPKNFKSEEYLNWLKSLKYGDPRRILISDFW